MEIALFFAFRERNASSQRIIHMQQILIPGIAGG